MHFVVLAAVFLCRIKLGRVRLSSSTISPDGGGDKNSTVISATHVEGEGEGGEKGEQREHRPLAATATTAAAAPAAAAAAATSKRNQHRLLQHHHHLLLSSTVDRAACETIRKECVQCSPRPSPRTEAESRIPSTSSSSLSSSPFW